MPAIFRSKKRLKDNYWVPWYPNYQWRSSNLNSGVVAPDIHVKSPGDNGQGVIHIEFKNSLLECSEFLKYNAEYPGFDIPAIVEARLRNNEHFGVFYDYEHVVTQEDLNRAQASETTQRVLQKHAELVSQGMHMDEIEAWLESAGQLRRQGFTLSEALELIRGGNPATRVVEGDIDPPACAMHAEADAPRAGGQAGRDDLIAAEAEKREMFAGLPARHAQAGLPARPPARRRTKSGQFVKAG